MAYANWLIPSKTQGSGNDTVNVTAGTDNTGRSPRQTTMTFKASGVSDVARTVIQAGKPEFVNIQSAAAVSKDGVTTLTIEGTSNSQALTFSLTSGDAASELSGQLRQHHQRRGHHRRPGRNIGVPVLDPVLEHRCEPHHLVPLRAAGGDRPCRTHLHMYHHAGRG